MCLFELLNRTLFGDCRGNQPPCPDQSQSSCSLHGLIIADSFHVPNLHITLDNKMFGDGYKYRDYYSAFGLEHSPFDCAKGDVPPIKMIRDTYSVSAEAVEQKKEALFKAFPKL